MAILSSPEADRVADALGVCPWYRSRGGSCCRWALCGCTPATYTHSDWQPTRWRRHASGSRGSSRASCGCTACSGSATADVCARSVTCSACRDGARQEREAGWTRPNHRYESARSHEAPAPLATAKTPYLYASHRPTPIPCPSG